MLHTHTKFLGNRPVSSGKEDFRKDFTIHECGGPFGHVTEMPRTNVRSTYPRRLHIQSGFDLPSGFKGKRCFSIVNDADGRTDAGPWVSYKLTYESWAQVS